MKDNWAFFNISWQTSEDSRFKSRVPCQLSLNISYSPSPCGTSNSRKQMSAQVWYFEARLGSLSASSRGTDLWTNCNTWAHFVCSTKNLLIIRLLHHILSLDFALKSRFLGSLKKARLWGWTGFTGVECWLSACGSFGWDINCAFHPANPCSLLKYIHPDSPILS